MTCLRVHPRIPRTIFQESRVLAAAVAAACIPRSDRQEPSVSQQPQRAIRCTAAGRLRTHARRHFSRRDREFPVLNMLLRCVHCAAIWRRCCAPWGFRDLEGRLSCVMAFGSDGLGPASSGRPKPKDLHPFREIRGRHRARGNAGPTSYSIFARRGWICASSWRRKSCRGSGVR